MAAGGADASLGEELTALEKTLSDIELRALLDDPLDRTDAFVCLRAPADAVDDAAWVEMMLSMYTRWAERSGLSAQILFGLLHEQAGLRAAVLAMLRGKLYRIERRRHDEDLAKRFDERGEPIGGEIVRSFVLEPYQQAEDLTTGARTVRVEDVLSGDLDDFLLAAARRRNRLRGSGRSSEEDDHC